METGTCRDSLMEASFWYHLILWGLIARRRHPALPRCHQWDWSLRLVRGQISLIDPLDSHNSRLGVLSIHSSKDELQLVGSTSVDGALSDTTSPPIKTRASTQVNRVPDLFVRHQSGLTNAEKLKKIESFGWKFDGNVDFRRFYGL